jgi:hypothetical protein
MCWMFSFEGKRLLRKLVHPLWRLRDMEIAIYDKKKNSIFYTVYFHTFLAIKSLEPDWIRIRIKLIRIRNTENNLCCWKVAEYLISGVSAPYSCCGVTFTLMWDSRRGATPPPPPPPPPSPAPKPNDRKLFSLFCCCCCWKKETIGLKVLSSEMDPTEIRLIRQASIKERGSVVF